MEIEYADYKMSDITRNHKNGPRNKKYTFM